MKRIKKQVKKSKGSGSGDGGDGGVGPHIFELSRVLHEFAASGRYAFLKTLQVGRFLDPGGQSLGVVAELTFEKLIELGSKKLAKLRWLSPAQTESLVKLLRTLATETPGQEIPPLISPTISRGGPQPREASAAPESEDRGVRVDDVVIYGSVEAENRLRDTLKSLKSSAAFEQVADLPLSKFWKPEWVRSPFEEALTVRQLGEIDIANILKKRTMNLRRIAAMIAALEATLRSVGLAHTPAPERRRPDRTSSSHSAPERPFLRVAPSPTHGVAPEPLIPWHVGSLSRRAAIRLLWRELDSQRFEDDPIGRLCSEVASALTVEELAGLLATVESEGKSVDFDAVREKLSGVITEKDPTGILAPWRAVLAGAGVHISELRGFLTPTALSAEAADLITVIFLVALRAQPARIVDHIFNGIWTDRPALLPMLIENVLSRLPLDEQALEFALRQVLPDRLSEEVGQLLRARLQFSDGLWRLHDSPSPSEHSD
jgi:hypothetical protein